MKKLILSTVIVLALSLSFTSCRETKEGDTTEVETTIEETTEDAVEEVEEVEETVEVVNDSISG